MYLKTLRIQNYASHADSFFDDLGPITVLIGPNGSGKTSVFDAIRTFSRILVGEVSQAFGPPPYSFEDRVFAGASSNQMMFEGVFGVAGLKDSVKISVTIGNLGREDMDAGPSILDEIVEVAGEKVFDRTARLVRIKGISNGDVKPGLTLLATLRSLPPGKSFEGPQILERLMRSAGRVVNYRLEPRELARPSVEPREEDRVRLSYEGENLAALLLHLSRQHPQVLKTIVSDLQQGVSGLSGISFNSAGVDRVGFALNYSDVRRRVLAPNVSSGTRLLLGLITLLRSPSNPHIACLEEPETGLTPDAVRVLLNLLSQIASAEGNVSRSQFFISTHSPFALVDTWNQSSKDLRFIRRLHIEKGRTVVKDCQSIVDEGDSGLVTKRDGTLGLKAAEEIMCGRFLPISSTRTP